MLQHVFCVSLRIHSQAGHRWAAEYRVSRRHAAAPPPNEFGV